MSLSRRCGESVDGNGQAPSEAGPPFVPAEARSVRSHPSRQEVSPPGAPASPPPLESARPSHLCNAPFSGFANCVLDEGHEGRHAHTRVELPYPEAPLASRKAEPRQWRVTETLEGRHPLHTDYPLLPGDILTRSGSTWTKQAPGLGIFGFNLSDEDEAGLEPADDARWEIA